MSFQRTAQRFGDIYRVEWWMREAGSVICERGTEVCRDITSIFECSVCKLKLRYYTCRPTKSELRVV